MRAAEARTEQARARTGPAPASRPALSTEVASFVWPALRHRAAEAGFAPPAASAPRTARAARAGAKYARRPWEGGHGRQDSQGELRGDGGDGKEEAVPQDGGDGQGRSRRQGGHDPPPGAGAAPVGAVG